VRPRRAKQDHGGPGDQLTSPTPTEPFVAMIADTRLAKPFSG
jgi:hypothetical protein